MTSTLGIWTEESRCTHFVVRKMNGMRGFASRPNVASR
jgi:hypothetical protein